MRNYKKYKKIKTRKKKFHPYLLILVFLLIIVAMSVGYGAFVDIIRISGKASARYKNYTINYELNSGINPQNPVTAFTIADDFLLPIPTRNNFVFGGWYLYSNFSGNAVLLTSDIDVTTLNPPNDTVILYAKWITDTVHTITYELNGGTNPANQVTTFTGVQSLTILEPTKTGCIFDGWYDNSSFTGTPITSTAGLTGDTTLYAKWIEQYIITYVLNGGTQAANQVTTFLNGQSFTILDASRTDCDFEGWYTSSNFTGSAITSTSGLSGNTTLYAKYTKNVEFLVDTTSNSITLTSNQISSSNTASYNNYINMVFEGFNSTNRTITRIDVNVTYSSSGGQTKRITCNLNSGVMSKTETLSFTKNGTTTNVSFTGLNIGQNESFTISNAEDFPHNRSLTISSQTITVYF